MSKIFAIGFINEMQDYAMKAKAEFVRNKCIRVGKLSLARKIARKYGIVEHDDCMIAFSFALNEISLNKK